MSKSSERVGQQVHETGPRFDCDEGCCLDLAGLLHRYVFGLIECTWKISAVAFKLFTCLIGYVSQHKHVSRVRVWVDEKSLRITLCMYIHIHARGRGSSGLRVKLEIEI
jgi:hypothetical protein